MILVSQFIYVSCKVIMCIYSYLHLDCMYLYPPSNGMYVIQCVCLVFVTSQIITAVLARHQNSSTQVRVDVFAVETQEQTLTLNSWCPFITRLGRNWGNTHWTVSPSNQESSTIQERMWKTMSNPRPQPLSSFDGFYSSGRLRTICKAEIVDMFFGLCVHERTCCKFATYTKSVALVLILPGDLVVHILWADLSHTINLPAFLHLLY